MSDFPDIAVLRTAGGGGALPLLRVFIGGFASRHDLPVDRLDDIELAVETLLAEEPEGRDDVILEICAVEGGLRLRLDGLRNQSVRAALLASDAFRPCEGCLLDVRVLLDSLLDGFRVLDAAAGSFSVEMNKRTS